MKLDTVYVTYWSLRDPLCQSQSLPVLRALAQSGRRLGLVSFEQAPWAVPAEERESVRAALAAEGLWWSPLTYHRKPALLSTAFDILAGAWRCMRLARKGGARLMHGRATVPTAIAWLASRLTGALFFNDADGPLSEEYVDAGIWSRGSLPHRLTGRAERLFLKSADASAVLSELRRVEVARLARSEVTVLPCGVDTKLFAFDASARERTRRELGLHGTVLVYSGKAGGWYLTDAVLDFARAAQAVFQDVTLLVLTPGPPQAFEKGAADRNLRCLVRQATRTEMPAYLSAADAGLSFRLDTPSQRACSPIKNGEYLACGLPVVTTLGAGDYSDLVTRSRVGVVTGTLDAEGLLVAARTLHSLLAEADLRSRCRAVAEAEVSLTDVVVPRYLRIYEGLLGPVQEGAA